MPEVTRISAQNDFVFFQREALEEDGDAGISVGDARETHRLKSVPMFSGKRGDREID